jgi:hypothetical protein
MMDERRWRDDVALSMPWRWNWNKSSAKFGLASVEDESRIQHRYLIISETVVLVFYIDPRELGGVDLVQAGQNPG